MLDYDKDLIFCLISGGKSLQLTQRHQLLSRQSGEIKPGDADHCLYFDVTSNSN